MILVMDGYLRRHLYEKTLWIRGVRMLFISFVLKSLNSIEKIRPRMMCAAFNDNLCSTIVSCYSPINASDEIDISSFNNELCSLDWHIPKHNVPVIGGYMNAKIEIINSAYATRQIKIIAIAPRSTLARSGSTWYGAIYG